jgi:hypothetical protein
MSGNCVEVRVRLFYPTAVLVVFKAKPSACASAPGLEHDCARLSRCCVVGTEGCSVGVEPKDAVARREVK